jgi:hypothetical protein
LRVCFLAGAKKVHYFNVQNWKNYRPVAKEYNPTTYANHLMEEGRRQTAVGRQIKKPVSDDL